MTKKNQEKKSVQVEKKKPKWFNKRLFFLHKTKDVEQIKETQQIKETEEKGRNRNSCHFFQLVLFLVTRDQRRDD